MDVDQTLARLVELAQVQRREAPPIFLDEYLELLGKNPLIGANAHERIYAMIREAGWEELEEAQEVSFPFFARNLYGLNPALERIVRYYESAAQGHDTRRRILLLWGPPGGAKSTIAALLKRGLEQFTSSDLGAVYALKGCPMHEDPLHLVPPQAGLREELGQQYGVSIEGSLCPVCRQHLQELDGDFLKFPIGRVYFSEAERVGIGTFEPSDPKSQSIEQLTGGINFRGIEEYGSDDHPLALDWSGEFMKANRGLFEAIEFVKNEREFLHSFLSVAQERQFKVPKFGMIDADFSIIAHTNEAEFRRFVGDQKNEALRDRLYTIAVPYNVSLSAEKRIYSKLLCDARRRTAFHLAPHTLETASTLAILTRLTPYPSLEPLEKLKLYDGREAGEWKLVQVPEIKRAAEHEALEGLGPRAIINVLASAATEHAQQSNQPCLNPISTLLALKDYIERLEIDKVEREKWLAFLADTRAELDRTLKNEVRKAFVPAFEEKAQDILNVYLNNVEAHCQNTKLRDPITDEELAPDEKLMRAIEEQIAVSENAKEAFRQGVLIRIGIWLRQGRPLTYRADDQLGTAIEGYLFEQLKDLVAITVSKTNPDPEQVKRLNEVMRVMVEQRGYCNTCASAVLDYVGAQLNR